MFVFACLHTHTCLSGSVRVSVCTSTHSVMSVEHLTSEPQMCICIPICFYRKYCGMEPYPPQKSAFYMKFLYMYWNLTSIYVHKVYNLEISEVHEFGPLVLLSWYFFLFFKKCNHKAGWLKLFSIVITFTLGRRICTENRSNEFYSSEQFIG